MLILTGRLCSFCHIFHQTFRHITLFHGKIALFFSQYHDQHYLRLRLGHGALMHSTV